MWPFAKGYQFNSAREACLAKGTSVGVYGFTMYAALSCPVFSLCRLTYKVVLLAGLVCLKYAALVAHGEDILDEWFLEMQKAAPQSVFNFLFLLLFGLDRAVHDGRL